MSLPEYLTTREVAALLRIKERKVYDLAAAGAIPVCRVTGKLLFPADLVQRWLQRHVEYDAGRESLAEHPRVLAGSHDPLLEWALRESGSGIASFFDGSHDGLGRVAAGEAMGAGVHLRDPESGQWNRPAVEAALFGLPVVLVEWARRRQGLVLPAGNPARVTGLGDLEGQRLVPRQPGSGSRQLFAHLLEQAGISEHSLMLVTPPARSENEVALAVAQGKAAAGLAVEAAARPLGLHFLPLAEERYDLLLWRRDYFQPAVQRLLGFCRGEAFARRAAELGGYALAGHGDVHYNGP